MATSLLLDQHILLEVEPYIAPSPQGSLTLHISSSNMVCLTSAHLGLICAVFSECNFCICSDSLKRRHIRDGWGLWVHLTLSLRWISHGGEPVTRKCCNLKKIYITRRLWDWHLCRGLHVKQWKGISVPQCHKLARRPSRTMVRAMWTTGFSVLSVSTLVKITFNKSWWFER